MKVELQKAYDEAPIGAVTAVVDNIHKFSSTTTHAPSWVAIDWNVNPCDDKDANIDGIVVLVSAKQRVSRHSLHLYQVVRDLQGSLITHSSASPLGSAVNR